MIIIAKTKVHLGPAVDAIKNHKSKSAHVRTCETPCIVVPSIFKRAGEKRDYLFASSFLCGPPNCLQSSLYIQQHPWVHDRITVLLQKPVSVSINRKNCDMEKYSVGIINAKWLQLSYYRDIWIVKKHYLDDNHDSLACLQGISTRMQLFRSVFYKIYDSQPKKTCSVTQINNIQLCSIFKKPLRLRILTL